MSSQRGERVERLRETLLNNWGDDETQGVSEALERAELAASSTPKEEMKRCPRCFSVKIHFKTSTLGWRDVERREGSHKCSECWSHFSNPHPPISEYREDLFAEIDDAECRARWLAVYLWGEQ